MEFAQSGDMALQRIADAAGVSLILILSDINMPGMTGLELLPKAKAVRPDVPVIMITAYGDVETKRKALEGGAEALFTKPIDFGMLRSEIDTRVYGPRDYCLLLSLSRYNPVAPAFVCFWTKADIGGFRREMVCLPLSQSGQERRILASAQKIRGCVKVSQRSLVWLAPNWSADARRLCLRYQSPPPSITQSSAPRLTSQCALYEQSYRDVQSRELRRQTEVRMPLPQAIPQARARA